MSNDLRKLKTAAGLIGARVFDVKLGGSHTCEVFSPQRTIWKASGNHCFVDSSYKPWKPDYRDLLERLSLGFESCPDPYCEWCNEDNPDDD